MARFHMNNIVDYKRLDKVNVGHNVTGAFDFHDICRVLLVRMLRRKHPNKRMNPIYTEYNPEEPNENYPDIWMKIGKDVYVWELQEKITKDWQEQIIKKHENVDLIIVPLDKVESLWEDKIGYHNGLFAVEDLKKILEEYVI